MRDTKDELQEMLEKYYTLAQIAALDKRVEQMHEEALEEKSARGKEA